MNIEKELILGILQSFTIPVIAGLIMLILWKLNEVPFFNEIFKGIYRRYLK